LLKDKSLSHSHTAHKRRRGCASVYRASLGRSVKGVWITLIVVKPFYSSPGSSRRVTCDVMTGTPLLKSFGTLQVQKQFGRHAGKVMEYSVKRERLNKLHLKILRLVGFFYFIL